MLSSKTETVSFFFFFFNEIDVASYDLLAQGIYGAVQLSAAVAFVSLLLKIAVARYLF